VFLCVNVCKKLIYLRIHIQAMLQQQLMGAEKVLGTDVAKTKEDETAVLTGESPVE
jgi:hypothetical protein